MNGQSLAGVRVPKHALRIIRLCADVLASRAIIIFADVFHNRVVF